MATNGLQWDEVYSGKMTQVEFLKNDDGTFQLDDLGNPVTRDTGVISYDPTPEPDAGAKALLGMIHESKREEANIMLTPMLAAIRMAVGPIAYATFCADMQRSADLYNAGDREAAYAIMLAYGIPMEQINEYEAVAGS